MNFNDVYEFFRNGGGDGAEMPYYFIALNESSILQTGGSMGFVGTLKMLLAHIEGVREMIKRHGKEVGIDIDVEDENIWAEFLLSLVITEKYDCTDAESQLITRT